MSGYNGYNGDVGRGYGVPPPSWGYPPPPPPWGYRYPGGPSYPSMPDRSSHRRRLRRILTRLRRILTWLFVKFPATLLALFLVLQLVPLTQVLWTMRAPLTSTRFMELDDELVQDPDAAAKANPVLTAELRKMLSHRAYEWVNIDHVSADALKVLVSREDHGLLQRPWPLPFDFDAFWKRAQVWLEGKGDPQPSGSTIPQQSAKNMFTDGERSAVRKAIEAEYAVWMSATQTPRELLEVYMNLIEFGPGVYGICAASWNYYDKPPSQLTIHDMATLVGLMPSPKEYVIYDNRGPGKPQTSETVRFARAHAAERVAQLRSLPDKAQREVFTVSPDAPGASCSSMPASLKSRQAVTQPRDVGRFPGDQAYWPRLARQYSCGDLSADVKLDQTKLRQLAGKTAGACRPRSERNLGRRL